MSAITLCRAGVAEIWWTAPIAWVFARALATSIPLESFRQAVGRASATLGYGVTCVPCCSAWLALVPSVALGMEISTETGIAAWAGAWGGALLLDAVHDRLRADLGGSGRTPKDWPIACNACGGRLAGLQAADLAVIVAAGNVILVHRECPKA